MWFNKTIYMILHGYVKQCKYITIKNDFYLRRWNFIVFLNISQLNGPLPKKNHQNAQLIHMILQEGMVIKDI